MLPKHILVPFDFSDGAEQALDYACDLAERAGSTICLVNAIGPTILDIPLSSAAMDELVGERADALAKLADRRRHKVPFATPIVTVADPRDAILSAAKSWDADLIVMGTHGRRGLSRMLIGSVAEETVRAASCPVLTVRGTSKHAPATKP